MGECWEQRWPGLLQGRSLYKKAVGLYSVSIQILMMNSCWINLPEESRSSHHSFKIFVESPFAYRGNIRFLNLIFKLSKTLAPVKLSNLISYCSLHIHSFQLKYIILFPKTIPCCSLCLQFSPSIFSSEILAFKFQPQSFFKASGSLCNRFSVRPQSTDLYISYST